MKRRLKLAAAAGLMFIGSWMTLGSPVKAVVWTAILFSFVWLAFRIPPGDRHDKP